MYCFHTYFSHLWCLLRKIQTNIFLSKSDLKTYVNHTFSTVVTIVLWYQEQEGNVKLYPSLLGFLNAKKSRRRSRNLCFFLQRCFRKRSLGCCIKTRHPFQKFCIHYTFINFQKFLCIQILQCFKKCFFSKMHHSIMPKCL